MVSCVILGGGRKNRCQYSFCTRLGCSFMSCSLGGTLSGGKTRSFSSRCFWPVLWSGNVPTVVVAVFHIARCLGNVTADWKMRVRTSCRYPLLRGSW